MNWLSVFVGGGLGSLVRYFIARSIEQSDKGFPWGTFLANFISCIILGFMVHWFVKHPPGENASAFFLVGFCGGFSTFSTFSNETFTLLSKQAYGMALLNVGGSVAICLLAIYLGLSLARLL